MIEKAEKWMNGSEHESNVRLCRTGSLAGDLPSYFNVLNSLNFYSEGKCPMIFEMIKQSIGSLDLLKNDNSRPSILEKELTPI
jgi:hypothetical protein